MDATALADRLLSSVPANVTVGVRVVSAVDGRAEVAADVPHHLQNVIGSMHASGLVGLVDACGLAAIISALPDAARAAEILPLGRAAQLQFLAPATGELHAHCELTDDARAQLTQLADGAKARFCTETTISSGDTTACVGRFEWSIRLASVV